MCVTPLLRFVVLDFRGTEVQRYRGECRNVKGLQVKGWETLLIYKLKYKGGIRRTYILRGSDQRTEISMEEHMETYSKHMGRNREWRKHMEKEWWQRGTCGKT